MQLHDTADRFGIFSIIFHWLSALLVGTLFFMGKVMIELPRGIEKAELKELHQSLGMVFLLVVLVRLIWRIRQGFPQPVDPGASFLNIISRVWHWSLLLIIIAIPVSGFIASDTGFRDISFFGLITFPDLLGFDYTLHEQFEGIHEFLANLIIPLVGIHVLAALKHHFWDKDDTLNRMIGRK